MPFFDFSKANQKFHGRMVLGKIHLPKDAELKFPSLMFHILLKILELCFEKTTHTFPVSMWTLVDIKHSIIFIHFFTCGFYNQIHSLGFLNRKPLLSFFASACFEQIICLDYYILVTRTILLCVCKLIPIN